MITVSTSKRDGKVVGFHCSGHAMYAESGSDILCSAVSALVINAVNSIESFTSDQVEYREKDGDVWFRINGTVSPEAELLLASMLLGIRTIEEQYGSAFVHVAE